jgi:hypothetical protein
MRHRVDHVDVREQPHAGIGRAELDEVVGRNAVRPLVIDDHEIVPGQCGDRGQAGLGEVTGGGPRERDLARRLVCGDGVRGGGLWLVLKQSAHVVRRGRHYRGPGKEESSPGCEPWAIGVGHRDPSRDVDVTPVILTANVAYVARPAPE